MSEQNKPLTESEIAASLNRAFDESKLKFHNRGEALQAFKEGREIVFEGGQPYAKYDGVVQPLSDALAAFGADNRSYIDARSRPRDGVGSSRPGRLSKADLKTVADKVAFIAEHGEEAFERLPLTSPDTAELRTFEQWLKLPTKAKTELIAKDPDIISKLKHETGARKVFIDTERMERTNPNYRGPGWSRKAIAKLQ